ncbi:hypothetical protein OIO90_000008 [Microbotryomycetes sp. JL221]|nr:hypothetical protein OIO90_000008 [Microbotryomycetes sp. JL221]
MTYPSVAQTFDSLNELKRAVHQATLHDGIKLSVTPSVGGTKPDSAKRGLVMSCNWNTGSFYDPFVIPCPAQIRGKPVSDGSGRWIVKAVEVAPQYHNHAVGTQQTDQIKVQQKQKQCRMAIEALEEDELIQKQRAELQKRKHDQLEQGKRDSNKIVVKAAVDTQTTEPESENLLSDRDVNTSFDSVATSESISAAQDESVQQQQDDDLIESGRDVDMDYDDDVAESDNDESSSTDYGSAATSRSKKRFSRRQRPASNKKTKLTTCVKTTPKIETRISVKAARRTEPQWLREVNVKFPGMAAMGQSKVEEYSSKSHGLARPKMDDPVFMSSHEACLYLLSYAEQQGFRLHRRQPIQGSVLDECRFDCWKRKDGRPRCQSWATVGKNARGQWCISGAYWKHNHSLKQQVTLQPFSTAFGQTPGRLRKRYSVTTAQDGIKVEPDASRKSTGPSLTDEGLPRCNTTSSRAKAVPSSHLVSLAQPSVSNILGVPVIKKPASDLVKDQEDTKLKDSSMCNVDAETSTSETPATTPPGSTLSFEQQLGLILSSIVPRLSSCTQPLIHHGINSMQALVDFFCLDNDLQSSFFKTVLAQSKNGGQSFMHHGAQDARLRDEDKFALVMTAFDKQALLSGCRKMRTDTKSLRLPVF